MSLRPSGKPIILKYVLKIRRITSAIFINLTAKESGASWLHLQELCRQEKQIRR